MRRQLLVLVFISLGLTVGACEILGLTPASECGGQARDYAGKVVGAFNTTVGAIRDLEPREGVPQRWPDLAPDHPAVLCYIDGEVVRAPPAGPNGEVPPPFNRAVVAIVDGHSELIIAGYHDQLPVRAP